MEKHISIDLLERPPKTLSVLVYLWKHGRSNMSEIKKGLGIAPQTLYTATKRLKELDLIFENDERGFPKKVYLNLTRQGERVAESLDSANEIVSKTISGYMRRLAALRKGRKTRKTAQEIMEMTCKLGDLFFSQGKWDEALEYCSECSSLAKELGNLRHEGRSRWVIGEIQRRRGQTETALEHFERSSEIFQELEDRANLSLVHYSFGAMFEREGRFDEALSEYEMSQNCAKEADHEISLGRSMIGVGRLLGRQGKYDRSYRELMNAVRLFEKIDAIEELPLGYGNLGATTIYLDVDEAMEWYTKSIEMAESIGDVRLMATGWMNIAGCLVKKSQYKQALENLEQARDVVLGIDDKKMLSSLHIQYGILYREQRKWTKAREAFGEAIDLADRWNLPYHLANAIFNLALLDAGTSYVERAVRRLERAKEIFEELGNDDKVKEVQKSLDGIKK